MLTLNVTPTLILILTLPRTKNLIIALTPALCCQRYYRRSNCRRSKCWITLKWDEKGIFRTYCWLAFPFLQLVLVFREVRRLRRLLAGGGLRVHLVHGCVSGVRGGSRLWGWSCGGSSLSGGRVGGLGEGYLSAGCLMEGRGGRVPAWCPGVGVDGGWSPLPGFLSVELSQLVRW